MQNKLKIRESDLLRELFINPKDHPQAIILLAMSFVCVAVGVGLNFFR